MRIKDGFMLRNVAGDHIVVPVGDHIVDFNAMVLLNESGAFLWRTLAQDLTEQDLIRTMQKEYEIDLETASQGVREFLALLKENDFLD